jgi:hypothetical protein
LKQNFRQAIFWQISAKKLAFCLKSNVMLQFFFHKCCESKTPTDISAKFFGGNFFLIITLVPDCTVSTPIAEIGAYAPKPVLCSGLPDFALYKIPKTRKIYQMTIKDTKCPKKNAT